MEVVRAAKIGMVDDRSLFGSLLVTVSFVFDD